jgi:hypothetical protein
LINKQPWQEEGVPWKTEAAFWSFIRSGLRSVWSKHPTKILFIQKFRVKVPNPNPDGRNETVWGMICAKCGGAFCMPVAKKVKAKIEALTGKLFNYIEINHKAQAGSLKNKEDLGKFASNLLYVTFDDLESVCKQCHGVHTYSEKNSVSAEEAALQKEVIRIIKAVGDKEWLLSRGITPEKNAKKRREQIVTHFRGGKI